MKLLKVVDGTHPFLGGKISRETQRKRILDGSHHFLGKNNPSHNRIADGTHHFLDSQVSRKGNYAMKLKRKGQRREFYRWVSVILTAKSVCEERVYQKRIREGFFDKDIPDTSKSEQMRLFENV